MKGKFRELNIITLTGCLLFLFGVILAVIGYGKDLKGFISNLSIELLSIAITILVIDTLYRRHEKKQDRAMLISRLGSTENHIAKQAARDLRQKKWLVHHRISLWRANLENAELYDFDLSEANLTYANLKGTNFNGSFLDRAEFTQVDLEGAYFHRTSLRNAIIRSELPDYYMLKRASFFGADLIGVKFFGKFNGEMTESEHMHLQAADSLIDTIMPNGEKYNGCYNLPHDLAMAKAENILDNPSALADFYGVTLEEYLAGQEWYKNFDHKYHWLIS